MSTRENVAPSVIGRIARDLRSLSNDTTLPGVHLIVNEDDITDIQAVIEGPAGTPFQGGHFRMKLVLGSDFPASPPRGVFLTKIFHPNVSKTGDICVNTLKRDWKADLSLKHILLVVRCLLIEPYPESALNEEAGRMLIEDYEGYAKHARLMTSIHAKPGAKPAGSSGSKSVGGDEAQAMSALTGTGESQKIQRDPASADVLPAAKKLKPKAGGVEKKKAKKKGLRRL